MNNTYKYINLEYLMELSDGSKEFIEDMINIFIEQVPEFSTNMNSFYTDNKWEELSKLAHKAKSSVAVMGMSKLADELKSLELMAKKDESTENCKAIIDKFIVECNGAVTELETLIKEP
ncbi:MAG: Hpt domain-containing protein [Bacteroidales bacterium]|jgi:HPt (histidine-containing phosphotransfer) domain-containing protein|nr:Hpt domain-containing protein [Bacteroidales bacterium]